MRISRLISVCAAGCAVTLFAGCTSSSKSPSTASASSTAPSSSSAASSSSSSAASSSAAPASLAQLKKIVLQPADLPAGWKGTPASPDNADDAAYQAALAKCVGVRNTDPDKVADANSSDFALGDASISSSASSYPSQSDLDADIALVHSAKLGPCFDRQAKELFAKSLPAGTTVDSVSSKFTSGSAGGPSNVVGSGVTTVKLTARGQHVVLYLTVAFITGPLIEAEVDTQNVGKQVPASLVKAAVSAVANRAAKG
jgi:hypothetical protein